MPTILGLGLARTPGAVDLRVATDKFNSSSCSATWWSEDDILYVLDGDGFVWTASRFQNVTIPKGALITSAVFELTSKWFGAPPLSTDLLSVGIQQVDNAPTISGYADIQGRFNALASTVDWPTVGWVAGSAWQTPDLSTALQALVDRSGWASGNSLVILTRNKVVSSTGIGCHSGPNNGGVTTRLPRFQAGYLA